MSPFGVARERLSEIARQHGGALYLSEQIFLNPLAIDDRVSPDELLAMIRYRAIGQLCASFSGDTAALRAFLDGLPDADLSVRL